MVWEEDALELQAGYRQAGARLLDRRAERASRIHWARSRTSSLWTISFSNGSTASSELSVSSMLVTYL